ncbi:hypothetical protein, partial [uncultured Devosia sp.]|uniref:hypothetical protein n=1 Tax=uncultured Devosia sp. TaxID=211434 RepID=UPI0030EEC064
MIDSAHRAGFRTGRATAPLALDSTKMSKNAKNPFDRLEDEDRFGPWPQQSLAFLQMIDRTQFQKPRCIALEGW